MAKRAKRRTKGRGSNPRQRGEQAARDQQRLRAAVRATLEIARGRGGGG